MNAEGGMCEYAASAARVGMYSEAGVGMVVAAVAVTVACDSAGGGAESKREMEGRNGERVGERERERSRRHRREMGRREVRGREERMMEMMSSGRDRKEGRRDMALSGGVAECGAEGEGRTSR